MFNKESTKHTLKKLKNKAHKTLKRGLDTHLKLAVTGFSGSGKTAFISALVKHLTSQCHHKNLPFLDAVSEQRIIAVKQVPQSALDIPTFDYAGAQTNLLAEPAKFPASTKRINTLTLAIKFTSQKGIRQHFSSSHTLYLELIDYPGEWLVDLTMLNQSYQQWSEETLALLKSPTCYPYSKDFLDKLRHFDSTKTVDEIDLKALSDSYQNTLLQLKAKTMTAQLQPGRMLIPGDLEGAPILKFFPVEASPNLTANTETLSQYHQLNKRFEAYKNQVVQPFYKNYFCRFDRQLVLVDLLGALNEGSNTLQEQQHALRKVLAMFKYGQSNFLKRLVSPKIDKVLFAANKCDHVNVDQQIELVYLLNDMLGEQYNELRFAGTQLETMALSSVQCTEPKKVKEDGAILQCIYGKPLLEEQFITYLPPQPPSHLLTQAQWPEESFDYISFSPLQAKQNQLKHVRLDHALQYLIGDKLS